jgi:hypothetical protein
LHSIEELLEIIAYDKALSDSWWRNIPDLPVNADGESSIGDWMTTNKTALADIAGYAQMTDPMNLIPRYDAGETGLLAGDIGSGGQQYYDQSSTASIVINISDAENPKTTGQRVRQELEPLIYETMNKNKGRAIIKQAAAGK